MINFLFSLLSSFSNVLLSILNFNRKVISSEIPLRLEYQLNCNRKMTLEFNEEQLEKIKHYFQEKNVLPKDQAKENFKEMFKHLCNENYDQMIEDFDFDGDGALSEYEFMTLFQVLIRKTFKKHDENSDGFISTTDSFPEFPELGPKISFKEFVDIVIKQLTVKHVALDFTKEQLEKIQNYCEKRSDGKSMSISEAKLIFNCMIHEFSCDTIA